VYYRIRTEHVGEAALGALLQFVFGVGGLTAAVWAVPAVAALIHGGWSGLISVPIKDGFFPGRLPWLAPTPSELVGCAQVLCALPGLIGGVWVAVQCWRWLLVRALGIMTLEEFEDMMRSHPDF
jgi:hypothetical protein